MSLGQTGTYSPYLGASEKDHSRLLVIATTRLEKANHGYTIRQHRIRGDQVLEKDSPARSPIKNSLLLLPTLIVGLLSRGGGQQSARKVTNTQRLFIPLSLVSTGTS